MRLAHDVATVRRAEAAAMAALPPGALMARAAAGLASRCAELLGRIYGRRVVVLAGTGDNGGDALHAAATLARRGARVDVLPAAERVHPGGLAALRGAGGRVHAPGDLAAAQALVAPADLVLDGLLGIGGRGGLREPAAGLAALAATSRGLRVAVDLPSGVDADTGEVAGAAVVADHTVTFGALKPGLLVDPGAGHAGAVHLVDIGLGPHLPPAAGVAALDGADVVAALGTPPRESDKYSRGVVGVLAGSPAYTGAAVLAVGGAVAAGAGMVRYVGPRHPAERVRAAWPEVVVTEGDDPAAAGRVQAWVVGPGLGTDERALAALRGVLAAAEPVVVDADALTLLAAHPDLLSRRRGSTLLTPHAGEFARLFGGDRAAVEGARLSRAREGAARLGVTVLLKGSTTVVAEPGGDVLVNGTGGAWLATAGSGDVLAGACGALLAGGAGAARAAAVAAFLHGLAGALAAGPDRARAPIHAGEILGRWADAVRAVRA